MQQPGTCRPPSLGSPGRSFRTLNRVVGRGKWPGLIELFGAVWTADPSRHTRRPAVMPPTARIAPHMCSKREPSSATKVRQTIRSFTGQGRAHGRRLGMRDLRPYAGSFKRTQSGAMGTRSVPGSRTAAPGDVSAAIERWLADAIITAEQATRMRADLPC